jgi:uncharacterized protein YegP (UPF0339 family)
MNRPNFIFEIVRSSSPKHEYFWRCKAANGETRCHSENYTEKMSAVNAVRQFCKHMKKGSWKILDSWKEKVGPRFKRRAV